MKCSSVDLCDLFLRTVDKPDGEDVGLELLAAAMVLVEFEDVPPVEPEMTTILNSYVDISLSLFYQYKYPINY